MLFSLRNTLSEISLHFLCICSSKLNKLSARFPFLHATLPSFFHLPPSLSPLPHSVALPVVNFGANLLANSIIKSNINQQISGLASRRTCLPTGAQPSPVPFSVPFRVAVSVPTVPSPAQSSLAHRSSSGAQINELSCVESG